MSLLIPLILQSCFLVKLSALNEHSHIKKIKRKIKDKGQYWHEAWCKQSCIFSKFPSETETPPSMYQPVWGLTSTLPGGMPAASKGSRKKLLPAAGATCPLMPPSKERELLELTVGYTAGVPGEGWLRAGTGRGCWLWEREPVEDPTLLEDSEPRKGVMRNWFYLETVTSGSL